MEVAAAKDWGGVLAMMEQAGQSALDAEGPEQAMRVLAQACFDTLGDRSAHLKPGALLAGERQFFVAGAFIVTPGQRYHMLVGNVGFPKEQERLLVPIDGGHPGKVYATRSKLLLKNTDDHQTFKQYLKTARMGSTIFAPMIFKERFHGQLIMAAQARHTMRDTDLATIVAMSRIAAGAWIAHGGPAWLAQAYPPANGFYVDKEGIADGGDGR
ncbi:MAG: hypothetical protein K0Q43_1876 [Ramlibacter sp.]|jgi:hypothetical protein|nr:hypothetical protein [Ramlibacter sp.]